MNVNKKIFRLIEAADDAAIEFLLIEVFGWTPKECREVDLDLALFAELEQSDDPQKQIIAFVALMEEDRNV